MLAGALALTGCSKDFLETETTQFASADQISKASEKNPGLQNANIAGLYSTMYNTGTGGTDLDHDDFGQKGYDIYSDMLSGDMVLAGYTYGWYQRIVEYQATIDYTNISNYKLWRYYYRVIFGANIVIDGLGGNDAELESEEAMAIMGQAKAMRAYAYFYLAQFESKGYNPTENILPIYTTVADAAAPLSPQSDVYALIVSDLTDAVDLLANFNRTAKNEVDQSVAKGLLAYTYAAMNNYEQAKIVAQDVIDTGGYTLMSANEVVYTGDNLEAAGFNDVGTSGWMWGVDQTLDIGLDLVSWWGQVDLFTYSYAWAGDPKEINHDLFDKIPANDVRKGQFVNAYGDGVLYPINKFYAPGRTVAGQRNIETDYVYMRIAEMYLLLAESSAKTGDEATAKDALRTLLSERLDDTTYLDGLSGEGLLNEIYLQTRIELWGEGKIFLAGKRLGKTAVMGSNHLTFPGREVPFNSSEMTFEIPESERQNNPNIQ
ncbi:MAG: RagB/SusD family nutrient uptake outer membrane protein [Salinimicrobium sp.]